MQCNLNNTIINFLSKKKNEEEDDWFLNKKGMYDVGTRGCFSFIRGKLKGRIDTIIANLVAWASLNNTKRV